MESLKVFVAVAETHSFAAAADRLETTTASVSRRIKALEERLGVRLLQRTTRQVNLTEAGDLYYRTARQVLDDLACTEERLQEVTAKPQGDLRIAAPVSFGQRRLAPVVTDFAARHPRLRISLQLDDRENDLVAEGIDVALRIAYPADSGHVARPVGTVARFLCAAPAYLTARGVPASPAELTEHDCLHYSVIPSPEEWTFDGPGGRISVPVHGRFCSNNGDMLLEAAIQGLGIALLPDFIAADALADGRLERILADHERAPLTLFALYPSRRHLPAKTRLFIDHLAAALA